MASHNETGKEGEELAVHWLTENGFTVLHRNWRYSHYEIDIVASKKHPAVQAAIPGTPKKEAQLFLHFVEVKARNFSGYGFPEDSVSKKKFKHLQRAADQYLFLNPGHPWIQYDILCITLHKYKPPEYFFIEDVFL